MNDPEATSGPRVPEAKSATSPLLEGAFLKDREIPSLEAKVRPALAHLEHNFIFRKLGIAFDYMSRPGDFPRNTLPKPRETREDRPNPAGIGTGIADCTPNTCLLLDGYLLRLELGLSQDDEARIMDRLVAGLIRLGTAVQRGSIVRGLTADGRGFYNTGSWLHATHYAHGLLVAFQTPAIALESQAKLRDIYGKWVRRLEKDAFAFDELPPPKSLPEPVLRWERELRILHLLAVSLRVNGAEEWGARYEERASDEAFRPFRVDLPREIVDSDTLLSLQIALSDLDELDTNADRAVAIGLLRRKIAYRLLPSLDAYKGFVPDEPMESAVLDWRKDLSAQNAPEEELRARVHEAWPRIGREARTVRASAQAVLCLLLSGDEALIQEQGRAMADCIRDVPWDALWEIAPLAALVPAHALGHEAGLWDRPREAASPRSFLGEDYATTLKNAGPTDTREDGEPRKVSRPRRYFPSFLEKAFPSERKNAPARSEGRKAPGAGGGAEKPRGTSAPGSPRRSERTPASSQTPADSNAPSGRPRAPSKNRGGDPRHRKRRGARNNRRQRNPSRDRARGRSDANARPGERSRPNG
ncbi:MAG: hypothetical protein V1918_10090 [Planctomycetota bacterium]